MRPLTLCFIILILSGCGTDNPASSVRSLDRLLVGTWVSPRPGNFIEEFEDMVSIIFRANGTLVAPWGLAGRLVREYRGNYWQKGAFIGARGTGGTGEPGVIVKFARLEFAEWPEAPAEGLGLHITEVLDEFVETQLGFGPVAGMPSDKVKSVVDRLNSAALPPEAFGLTRPYLKIEQLPFQPQAQGPPS